MSKIFTSTDLQIYMSGVTLDTGISSTITDAVNAFIEKYTHRCFGETKQVTERYDLKYTLFLRHMDIISIESMVLGWPGQNTFDVQAQAYFFNQYGRVTMFAQFLPWDQQLNPSSLWRDYLTVQYTYGYTADGFDDDGTTPLVPDDLKMAALGIAAGFYNWATNNQKDVVSASIGTYKMQYIGAVRGTGAQPGQTDPDFALNHDRQNWAIIDNYQMKRL